MTQKNGADRPDDYKRFSSIDKEYDFQQSLNENGQAEHTKAENQTHKKENITDNTDVAGRYFEPSDYKGTTQLEKGLAETHEQVSDDYFEGTIDQNLD
ncbi:MULTISPECIES: YozQ family protein [Bacillus]|uniref:YozQ family protein n=1 Tax=Bacillus vallismortis TaxID=72361 RepID=A0AAP3CP95_BACVA|nr:MULTISPECIES: YozQ family protein [Bacillus]MCI3986692.1 YozQ family protein [Bacillus vallismortis]MCI4136985.1 YozQ family protein [Bacillus vallismortis]MCY7895177.1 YozQ family protein [Bacillus vallismortis]MCY7918931.1 YozQ family protein [Bacillus vallismortis]MCY8310378.1 YozQ family protein [Bacillus vallismortis]